MLAKIKQTYLQWGYNLPLLIAFFLPFGINYAIFILVWAIGFFAFDDVKNGLVRVFKNKWAYVLLGFFLIHALGYFFSVDKPAALNAIEIKLSFLAFPILLFASRYNDMQVKKVIISFVSGCVMVSMIDIFRACYLYFFQDFNAFFYSEFSYFMHPSYFAMYLIFAQLMVVLFYPKWLAELSNLNIKMGFMSVVFLTTIFLCSSKMGLITAFLLLPFTFCVILYHQGYKKIIAGLVIGLIIAIAAAYKLFPTPFERMKMAFKVTSSSQTIDKTDAESTAVRILIWKESVKLIKENIVFGTTAGDANDKLLEAYEREGLTGALRKKLNAHNQFLQTFIGTGIIGFVLLLCMTIGALIYGFIQKNYIFCLFSILIIFNFLVESMLQAQAGFIFFAFFFCILTQYNLDKFSSKNS
ncbi:MAG: O-antigen ligase family protein [Bacteroidetes bacterium]|nr:O-antigen ligase family protein [Bacteroidota bacterium]